MSSESPCHSLLYFFCVKAGIGILAWIGSLCAMAQTQITDDRDGSSYAVVKLGSLYWMTENLRYPAEGSICLEECDEIRFYDYHQLEGICPAGWRLPKMNDWSAFVDSFEGAEKVRMMEKNSKLFRVDFLDQFDLFENNALRIRPYGRMEGGAVNTGDFIDFWTFNEKTDARFHMHFTPYSVVGHAHKHHLKPTEQDEYRLFPVRCVCESEALEKQ